MNVKTCSQILRLTFNVDFPSCIKNRSTTFIVTRFEQVASEKKFHCVFLRFHHEETVLVTSNIEMQNRKTVFLVCDWENVESQKKQIPKGDVFCRRERKEGCRMRKKIITRFLCLALAVQMLLTSVVHAVTPSSVSVDSSRLDDLILRFGQNWETAYEDKRRERISSQAKMENVVSVVIPTIDLPAREKNETVDLLSEDEGLIQVTDYTTGSRC